MCFHSPATQLHRMALLSFRQHRFLSLLVGTCTKLLHLAGLQRSWCFIPIIIFSSKFLLIPYKCLNAPFLRNDLLIPIIFAFSRLISQTTNKQKTNTSSSKLTRKIIISYFNESFALIKTNSLQLILTWWHWTYCIIWLKPQCLAQCLAPRGNKTLF